MTPTKPERRKRMKPAKPNDAAISHCEDHSHYPGFTRYFRTLPNGYKTSFDILDEPWLTGPVINK